MAKNRYGDAGLNQLTTAQLEELLRMDYASQEHNEAAVFQIGRASCRERVSLR